MNSILFIAPSAYVFGGMATWLDYLVPGLEKSGWEVAVGLVSGKHHNAGAYLQQHPFRRSLTIKNMSGSREGRVRAISRAIGQVSPDLVVGVNIPDVYAAVEGLRSKKASNCKAVMTLHGILPELYDDMRQYSGLLDGVVCTNRLACALAGEAGGMEAARIHYAPYGVLVPESWSKRPEGQVLRIVHVGRIGDDFQKRVTDIPKIISLLEQAGFKYELRIIGSGDMEQELKENMARQISENRVVFTGALFGDAVSKMYDWADAFLLTSFWETGPIVLWEAMARNAVVVSSAYVGSGSEGSLINGQNCLMFPIGDAKSAAESLIKAADFSLRIGLSENGYKMVAEKYSRERSTAMWSEAFKKILSNPTRTSSRKSGEMKPSGRLDSIFGISMAESVREILGIRFEHRDAGGEWPHTNSGKAQEDQEFWEFAKALEAGKNHEFKR